MVSRRNRPASRQDAGAARVADREGPPSAPAWMRCFPPLHALASLLVSSRLGSEEDFLLALKKYLHNCAFVVAVIATVSAVVSWVIFRSDTIGEYLWMANTVIIVIFICVPWLVAKKHPEYSALCLDITLFGAGVLASIIGALAKPTYPMDSSSVQLLFLCSVIRTKFPLIMWPSLLGVYAFSGYLYVVIRPAEETNGFLLSWPEPIMETQALERALTFGRNALYTMLFVGMTELVQQEGVQRTAAAKASIQVAAELAVALGTYDTTRAQELIDEASEAKVIDFALLGAFEALVGNLTRYRPHLPNWVVNNVAAPVDNAVPVGDPAVVDDMGPSTTPTPLHTPSPLHTPASAHEAGDDVVRRETIMFQPGEHDVIMMELGFNVSNGEAGHALVDRVFNLAQHYSGEVHACIGNVIRVTWNTVTPTERPEVQAAQFACDVRRGNSGIVWGAVWAARAYVHLAGRHNHKTLLVQLPRDGVEAGQRVQQVSRGRGIIAVDCRVRDQARGSQMLFRPVEGFFELVVDD